MPEFVFGGLKAGAKGYLLKDTPPEELVSAIEKASRDETVLGGQIAARVMSELCRTTDSVGRTTRPEDDLLSGREAEVAKLVGAGATNREIALDLYITEVTVKNHISKILRKLDLRDRTQLALYAVDSGWTKRAGSPEPLRPVGPDAPGRFSYRTALRNRRRVARAVLAVEMSTLWDRRLVIENAPSAH